MIPRSLTLAVAGAGALLLGAAAPSGASAAAKCSTTKPTAVRVVTTAADSVTVKWRIPRRHPAKLSFRVARDGAVVGHTRGRSMAVNVKPGTRPRITVTAVVRGHITRCRAAVVVGSKDAGKSPAGGVVGLAARPLGSKRVVLSWDAATAGTRYRVLRNGKIVRRTKDHRTVVKMRTKAVRYQVVAVDRSGHVGARSSVVIIKAGLVAPTAPTGAAVSRLSDGSVRLTWGASRAIRARIVGYRIVRDGKTLQGVSGTSATLSSIEGRTYRVIAVDSNGWASEASAPVTVTADHEPPAGPGAPTATSVTDTSVSLTWTAARLPAGSTLRGYRVMRDGVVVTQVPGEAVSVGNLAPKSAHDWTVAAVDGLGHVGEPSPATRIVQADPSPTAGAAQAYLLASTDSSFAAFRKHYRQIGVVYPTFFDCDRGTGQLLGSDNRQIVSFAQDRKVKVMPRFNCQSTTMLHRIFTEPALREQWLSGITALLDQHGYDGVNVDFEKAAPGDRNLVTGFMAELSDRVHARGKLLSQAVSAKTRDVPNHPRSTAFDYAELSKYNDWLFVMAWGQHWSTSAPGPQDDINWVRGVADYVASMPNKEKFVLGSLFYAMDWPANGGPANPGTALNAAELQALIDRTGAKPQFDAPTGSWHLTYTDAAGVGHNVWWTDATAVGERMVIARERGLGVGFWRLGQEDERFWSDPRLPTVG